MTKEEAVTRLHSLAQAQDRLQASSSSSPPEKPVFAGLPHFGPAQAVEAKKAIQAFLKKNQDASKVMTNSRRNPQTVARFVILVEPVQWRFCDPKLPTSMGQRDPR